MFDLGKFAFGLISDLIWDVIKDGLKTSSVDFFQERKIKSRVEDATAEVIKDLLPFLEQEKVSVDKQQRLIETCVGELKPFSESPAELFRESLDGQKIFDSLYLENELPQVVLEDDLKDIYSLLFPRIATLLCKIPVAVKDWENEAWSENYRRFDEVVSQLKALFAQVDELASAPQKSADKTLTLLKRTLTQKSGLQLDITGLRAVQPLSGKFDDYFVLPEIKQIKAEDKEPVSVLNPNDCFFEFTNSGCLAVVVGAPGAGKSTWSKWLQRETLKTEWQGFGVRVEFRELKADELPSVYDLIRKVAGKQLAEDLTLHKIKKWLETCRIVFILDGFDEIKPTDRNKFIEWIKEIVEIAKGNPFIITSRILTTNHLEDIGDGWRFWSIEHFDKPRIVEYISKWYAHTPLLADINSDIDSEDLATMWLADSTIGHLTGNPLLLSTLLMVHHLDGKLPNGRANLYKRYVDGMLGFWDDRHKLVATDIEINPDEKRKIIRGIALHLFLSEQETIDEDLLIDWLNIFLPRISINASAEDVLTVLRERSGLIIGPGVYSFTHKTIAEFLVAEAILQGDQKDQRSKRIDRFHLFEKRSDDRWNTVLFLWSGMAPFIDMKSFVDQTFDDKDKSLFCGLVLDQYDRFPREIKIELFQKIKKISIKETVNWGVAGFPRDLDVSVKVPMLYLRGLANEKSFSDLMVEAYRDGIIDLDEIDFNSKVYAALWSRLVTDPESPEEWEAVLSKPFPSKFHTNSWKRVIISWILTVDRMTHESILLTYINIYRKKFPDFGDHSVIALLSSIIFIWNIKKRNSNSRISYKEFYDYTVSVVDVLLEIDLSPSKMFLEETKDWIIVARRDEDVSDL